MTNSGEIYTLRNEQINPFLDWFFAPCFQLVNTVTQSIVRRRTVIPQESLDTCQVPSADRGEIYLVFIDVNAAVAATSLQHRPRGGAASCWITPTRKSPWRTCSAARPVQRRHNGDFISLDSCTARRPGNRLCLLARRAVCYSFCPGNPRTALGVP